MFENENTYIFHLSHKYLPKLDTTAFRNHTQNTFRKLERGILQISCTAIQHWQHSFLQVSNTEVPSSLEYCLEISSQMPEAELVHHLSPGNPSAPLILCKVLTNNNGQHHFISAVGKCPSSASGTVSLSVFYLLLHQNSFLIFHLPKLQDGVWKS